MKYLAKAENFPEVAMEAEDTRKASIAYIKEIGLKEAVVTVVGTGNPVKWYVNEYSK
jgi:hypothetical protein